MELGQLRQEIIDELELTYGFICPLCEERRIEALHHIIPRGRDPTEPSWLNDKRNLIMLCTKCHMDRGQTMEGRIACLQIQQRRWAHRDYEARPWGEYLAIPYRPGVLAYNPAAEEYLCAFPDRSYAWMNGASLEALAHNPRHRYSGVYYVHVAPSSPVSITAGGDTVLTVLLHPFDVKGGFRLLCGYADRADAWVVGPLPDGLEEVPDDQRP